MPEITLKPWIRPEYQCHPEQYVFDIMLGDDCFGFLSIIHAGIVEITIEDAKRKLSRADRAEINDHIQQQYPDRDLTSHDAVYCGKNWLPAARRRA